MHNLSSLPFSKHIKMEQTHTWDHSAPPFYCTVIILFTHFWKINGTKLCDIHEPRGINVKLSLKVARPTEGTTQWISRGFVCTIFSGDKRKLYKWIAIKVVPNALRRIHSTLMHIQMHTNYTYTCNSVGSDRAQNNIDLALKLWREYE